MRRESRRALGAGILAVALVFPAHSVAGSSHVPANTQDCRLHQVSGPSTNLREGQRLPKGFNKKSYLPGLGPTGPIGESTSLTFHCGNYSESLVWMAVEPPARLRSHKVDDYGLLLSVHSSRPRTLVRSRPCLAETVLNASITFDVVSEATEEHFLSAVSTQGSQMKLHSRVNGLYYDHFNSRIRLFSLRDGDVVHFDLRQRSAKSRSGTGAYLASESSFAGEALHADDSKLQFSRCSG